MAIELIEFWASGCTPSLPCHRVIERLRVTNDIGMTIRSVDAWDAPREVADRRIVRLPTLVLLVDGTERARCTPSRPSPATITAWAVEHLPHTAAAAPARAASG